MVGEWVRGVLVCGMVDGGNGSGNGMGDGHSFGLRGLWLGCFCGAWRLWRNCMVLVVVLVGWVGEIVGDRL